MNSTFLENSTFFVNSISFEAYNVTHQEKLKDHFCKNKNNFYIDAVKSKWSFLNEQNSLEKDTEKFCGKSSHMINRFYKFFSNQDLVYA